MNTALVTKLTSKASTIPEASRGGSEEADQNPVPIAIWITMAMSQGNEDPKNSPSTSRRAWFVVGRHGCGPLLVDQTEVFEAVVEVVRQVEQTVIAASLGRVVGVTDRLQDDGDLEGVLGFGAPGEHGACLGLEVVVEVENLAVNELWHRDPRKGGRS